MADHPEYVLPSPTGPLVGAIEPLQSLTAKYDPESSFIPMLTSIAAKYGSYRAVRGDGSCAYRALLYGLCMGALSNSLELSRIQKYATDSITVLESLGYDVTAIEIFYDEFKDLFTETIPEATEETLHEVLTGPSAEYFTWYMRLLTSAHLKSNAEHFANFLDSDFSDIADFCAREVEPSGKECEQIQVIALADALGCRVSVVYLDGHNEEGKFNEHHFGPKEAAISISMLYRPGHYDLLEK